MIWNLIGITLGALNLLVLILLYILKLGKWAAKIEGGLGRLEERQEEVEDGLGALEDRLGALESRLGGLEKRLETVERRLDVLEERLSRIEVSLDSLEEGMNRMETRLSSVESEQEQIRLRLDRLETGLAEVDSRLRRTSWALIQSHQILLSALAREEIVKTWDIVDILEPITRLALFNPLTEEELERCRGYLAKIRRKEIPTLEEAKDFHRLTRKLTEEKDDKEEYWMAYIVASFLLGVLEGEAAREKHKKQGGKHEE